MRFVAMAAALGISFFGVNAAFAQGSGWTSAGTYHHRKPVKTPHQINKAKAASRVTGAKVHTGGPTGASSGGSATSGAGSSGAHSHPLHGGDSQTLH
jgi:hypothetical protein